jgi:cytochrome c oxidase assembly protein subunit 11
MVSVASKKNLSLAINLCTIVVGMLLLTAASVPLYRLFCDVTGYGGTTAREEAGSKPVPVLAREVTIRFNADIAPELPWEFLPGQREVKIKVGEQKLVYYTARNRLNIAVKGTATYNVLPFSAGSHFVKIDCFCFQEQTLEANQEVSMPILFYIDPAIMDDHELDDVKTITLSYTFFPVKTDPSK